MKNNIKELKQRALKGDLSALNELRKLGLLSGDKSKYTMAPVSYAQRRLWFINKMDNSPAYNLPAPVILEGELNDDALEKALKEIVSRHEILRTVFVETDGIPYQKILNEINFTLVKKDLSETEDQAKVVSELINNESNRQFDLSKGPLLSCSLYKTGTDKYLFLFNMHHIISDGWSINVLISELTLLYNSFNKGCDNPLTPLKIQYKDYVKRHTKLIENDASSGHRQYWLTKFAGELPVSELLPDFNRPLYKTFNGNYHDILTGEELNLKIKNLCRQNGVSLFMFLLAAVNVFINKYTGKSDIIIGSPVSGREQRDLEDQIGFYVNSIPLRNQVSTTISFNSFLEEVKHNCIEAYDHQAYPVDLLIEELNIPRDTGRNPLFETMLSLQDTDSDAIKFDGISAKFIKPERIYSKFDLHFNFEESPDNLKTTLIYNTDMYKSESIARCLKHFMCMLENIVNNPDEVLSKIELIPAEEKKLITGSFNDTLTGYPQNKTVAELFEQIAEQFPDKPAVVYKGKPLSYSQLNEDANKLALFLKTEKNLLPEEPVAIYMDRSHEVIISMLGILKAGGAYVPVDTKMPADRCRFILEDVKARVVLTEHSQIPFDSSSSVVVINRNFFETCNNSGNTSSGKTSSGLAYIIYTSGTTGTPKGSMIEDKSIIRLVRNTNYIEFKDFDRLFTTSSISFDAFTMDVWGMLLNGGTVFMEDNEDYLDPERLKTYFHNYKISIALISTGFFVRLLEADMQNELELFKGFNEVLTGGEVLPTAASNSFVSAYSGVKLINVYGPTENTTFTTAYNVTGHITEDIPIGKPVSNTTVYIFDENQNLCPVGVPGELYTGGDGVSRGYLNRPDLTKEKFVANPLNNSEILYRTGDIAKWDELGNIHFCGRNDDQVKIRGYRIETGEIEKAAAKYEGITKTKIVVQQESQQKELALYYTSISEISNDELKKFLMKSLPEYMVPKYCIKLEQFPLNQNGKVDTKAFPKPELIQNHSNEVIIPSNNTEKALAAIFKNILNVNDISVTDNFFNLGGHSLKAIRAVSAIQKELSVKITLKEFFTHPDIKSLEEIIRDKKREEFGNIPVIEVSEYYDLSHAQKRLWVLDKIEKSKSTYNIPLAVKINDEINPAALQSAFNNLIERHEILRTIFPERNGEPFQKIVESVNNNIIIEDFSSGNNADESALNYIIAEAHKSFNLAEYPLVKLYLLKTAEEQYILFLNIHHIICDGWSLSIIIDELLSSYRYYINKTGNIPAKPALQYKDYSGWLNEKLNAGEENTDRSYWLTKLAGEITPLDLPSDFRRPAVKTYEGESVYHTFSNDLKQKLEAFNSGKRSSMFMTLTALLKVLLHKYTGKEDIILGTPVAARNHPDLENQIGYYVNTLALRDYVNPEKSFAELLEEVKKTATDGYSHQMYPFDKIVEELKPDRDTSRSPLFDVMIVYQNFDISFANTFREIKEYKVPMKISKYDLTFNFSDVGDKLNLFIEYNTKIFKAERIEQIVSHLEVLLKTVIDDPAKSIKEISVLSSEEEYNLLCKFNDTAAAYPEEKNIIGLFEEAAEKYPEKIAVVYKDKEITYSKLNSNSNNIAANISRSCIVKPGEPIGVLVSPSENTIEILLAILKLGGAYVPLDPEYPDERIKHILSESKTNIIITSEENRERLKNIVKEINLACEIIIPDKTAVNELVLPKPGITPDTTAYIIFTSGSTGKPKGCPITHRNLVRLFINDRTNFDFSSSDVWIMAHSYCFDFSVWEMYGALLFGGKLIIPERKEVRDISAFVRLVREHKVTVLNQTPGAFYKFIDTVLGKESGNNLSLRYVIFGGDKLNPSKLGGWIKKYPADKVSLVNMYGITETTIHVTYHKLTDDEINTSEGLSNVGSPLPETKVYILDNNKALVPVGVYGEIYVSGTGLSRGYLNRPDLTAERFIPNPYKPGETLYRSGDIGRWLYDGTIEYVDRCDNQVQVRGFRVEIPEIELQLRRYPGVTDAVVIALDREGTKELAAYIVSGSELKINQLKSFLSSALPEYMIPSYFIRTERIPLTSNGKIDKKALPPAIQNIATGEIFESPANKIEAQLLELWQEVLSIESISIHDNFFDLGGNSILLVKLYAKINDKYPGKMELTDLFTKSRISEQAEFISEKLEDKPGTIKAYENTNSRPSSNDVAIIGVASRIGDCNTPDEFWKDLSIGVDFIGSMPEGRINDIKELSERHNIDKDSLKLRELCYLEEVDKFDYGFFKLSPGEASLIDPGQRLFIETACHALEDAGYGGSKLWGSKTGVFIGASDNLSEYSKFIEASENKDPNLLLAAQTPSILAARIPYLFNLKGPAILVDTACSSSLVAVHLACQSIREGKIDSALVGGIKLHLLPVDSGARLEIDSSDSRAHSFDDAANGTGGGEGVIAIFLKPLESALRDKDNIYAVIKGSEINQDGNSIGITAPDADAQAEAIEKAWLDAGIDPRTVSYIETHGTATKLGDPIEIDGISKAFRRYTQDKNFCAIGAVKANIGHLDTAAGLAGLLKAVLSLKYRKLAPLTHFNNPNRNIKFEESPVYINKELSDWTNNGAPLRCGISSFGLSGTNCHVVLEEAPSQEVLPAETKGKYLFALSSRTKDGLLQHAAKIKKALYQHPEYNPESICYTLSAGRGHYSHRLAVIFENTDELKQKLQKIHIALLSSEPEGIYYNYAKVVASNKKVLNENEITENAVAELSGNINSFLKEHSGHADKEVRTAEAYVKGADILWEEFYNQLKPAKISLPGYQFEKKRCWVTLSPAEESKNSISTAYGSSYDNIFLNNCILDTPTAAIYSNTFNTADWLLNEHRVMDIPTLVGVSYLQIAYEAGKNHLNTEQLCFRDFYLMQPLNITEGENLEVISAINIEEDNTLRAAVSSKAESGKWNNYARFVVSEPEEKTDHCIDIKNFINNASGFREVSAGKGLTGEVVSVSSKWNCLKKIYWNENESLAELEIPEEDIEVADQFYLYPPLMDAALSFAIDEPGYLPYSFGTVELRKKPGNKIYSHVQQIEKSSPGTRSYDITLTNEFGFILVVLKGFTLKKIKTSNLDSVFHELTWKQWPLKNKSGQDKTNIALLYNSECRDELIRKFKAIEGIKTFEITGDDFNEILADIFSQKFEKIIFMLPKIPVLRADDVERYLSKTLYGAFNLAKYLSANLTTNIDLLFTAINVREVSGEEALLNPINNSIAGLGQVIQRECPNVNCKFLDIDDSTTVSDIIDEIKLGFDESYYYRALRSGTRYIREIQPVNLAEKEQSELKLKEEGVYIITGGTGGIGTELALFMAKQAGIKLALISRSEFPREEMWDTLLKEGTDTKLCSGIKKLQQVKASAKELCFYSADVSNYDSLKKVIEEIRNQQGHICGVIHAAGVPGDGFIFNKSLVTFRDVIKSKIHGTVNLYNLIKEDNPDFFIMTSALTAVIPSAGQSDYTAANSFMDAYSSEINRAGIKAVSINLTSWKETGMAFELGVADDGIFKSITTARGVNAIWQIVQHNLGSVILGETDLSFLDLKEGLPFYFNTRLPVPKNKTAQNSAGPAKLNKVKLTGKENGNYNTYEISIAGVWGEVLGYNEININDNYYDLGGDSIHAIKIKSLLESKHNIIVTIGDLFNHLTIAELAEYLQSKSAASETSINQDITKSIIRPVEKKEYYPVSSAQRRLFVLDKLTTDKLSYHLPGIWNIKGKLNIQALEKAFNKIIDRHETLRTYFDLVQDEPVQFIKEKIEFVLPVLRLSEQEAHEYIHDFVKPFDLGTALLFRAEIIILSEENALMLFDAHHIIMDAYAIEIFKKELFSYYEGKEPEPVKIQYKDYSEWQLSYYKTKEALDKKAYWLNQFSGEIPVINLPVDYTRTSGQSSEAGTFTLCLDEMLTSDIKKVSAGNGISTFMILLGVYNIVLHKYTQQDDIITGVYSMGRDNSELARVIGMFINNLPVRSFPKDQLSIIEFLNNVKTDVINAYANQDYPFDELISELNISRDLNRAPLFDVVFSYMNFELSEIKNSGLQITDYRAETILSSEYDLMLYGIEAEDKIYITIKYKKSLFKKESIEKFAAHFTNTVRAVTVDKDSKIGDIDILLPEELEQLESFNRQYKKVSIKEFAPELIKKSMKLNAGNAAILYKERVVIYDSLNLLSNRLANYLRDKYSVKPGDLIGIMVERTDIMPAAMLGVIKSGAAYVGIDISYPQQRIEYILKDSKIKILLTEKNIADSQPFLLNSGIKLVNLETEGFKYENESEPSAVNKLSDPAYIIYTSGSTGQPKGVIITHKNLSAFLQWCLEEFKSTVHDVVYAVTSYCFDLSVFEIFYSLSAGKTIRILKSALEIPEYLEKDNKVLINTVPSLLSAIKDSITPGAFERISAINLAGEQIPQSLINSLNCRKTEVRNLYGPSEDTTYSTVYKFNEGGGKVLIGKPISNTSIYIVDSNFKLVPPGHSGEICITGDGLSKGYLYRKELTGEKFITNPFGKGRLYRTGDLGRWTEGGNIEYLGRIDRQVKVRGFRIEPGEIESNIKLFPGVDNAVVIANKKHSAIAAYISAKEQVDINALKEKLNSVMPSYMVPSFFVLMESIPLTPNGKIDVASLPEPETEIPDEKVEKLTLTEEILTDIWRKILEVNHLSKHDNFFDLGGHSLKALRLITQINREFNSNCLLSDVFEAPTIARFAEILENKNRRAANPLIPLEKASYYDISHAQHRLWILNRMEKNSIAYNIPIVYQITSALDTNALKNAFKALIKKHESFRTSFIEIDGEPKQVITDEADFTIEIVEVNTAGNFVNDSAELINKYISVPFDLSTAPLVKVTLLKNATTEEYILIINVHHIILDEWSIDIMTEDLAAFYGHYSGKRIIHDEYKFLPLAVQYKEYAQWHNQQIKEDNEASSSHKQYWFDKFKEPVPGLNLPSDFPRPKTQSFEGRTESFTLPREISDALKKLSTQNNSTLFVTTLALINVLFSKYTNQDDIVIGTPVANRAHPEMEGQVGFFINTLALRNKSDETETFTSFLNRVKKNTIEAFAHQVYPFDLLVDDLQLPRDLSRSPLFDVMLISQAPAGNVTKPSSGLEMKAIGFDYSVSKFDLSISYYEDGDSIRYYYEYNTALFKRERIENMFSHFCSLTEQILSGSEKQLSELSFVSGKEKESLQEISAGYEIPLENNSIVDLIEKQAAENPEKIAVVYKRNKLTYDELNSKANRLAHYLIENEGIMPGDFICIMLDRSEWSVISMLAVLKAGAVYVPIDSSYPQNRIEYMISNSSGKLIITTEENAAKYSGEIKVYTIPVIEEKISGFSTNNPCVELSAGERPAAYVIYTSGSTGEPKGVLGTHKCLLNLVEWQGSVIEGGLQTLQYAPHGFDVSVQEILFSLGTCGTLHMIENSTRYKMSLIADIIEKEKIELLTMPYSALNLFLSELEDYGKLSSVKHIITSGEQPYITDSLERLLKKFPDLKFHNQYGPSETHVVTSFMLSSNDGLLHGKVPTGRPINNTCIYLLNKDMEFVPRGIPGELYIGGYNLAEGYIAKQELTDKAFIKNPFGDGKLYKTGDIARWDYSGQLDFLGRNDGQVKVRGYRIELGEIESLMLKYPSLKEAAVKLVDDGDTKDIAAYLTCDKEIDILNLKEFLNSGLPSYMIPSFFVKLENMPHTPSGKIDYRSLPDPEKNDIKPLSVYVKPEGEVETVIAEVWEEILHLANISANDDFFEIGGNSIKAIRVMSKIQKRLGKKTFLNLIFQHPTIKKMASVITGMDERVKGLSIDITNLNKADGPNVFFLPPGIGYSFAYLEFAKYFSRYNVFGLNFIDSPSPAKTTASILINQQKEGDFYLFGHSAGGNMAYDVALELQKQGRQVGGIVLLDSYRQMELVNWSPEEYSNDAVLYIEQNHAEFLDEEIKEASLKKIVAYRAYLNARTENEPLNCPIIQIEATDEIRNFNHKISRSAWAELTGNFEVYQGFGGHMDMLKQPNLEKNGQLAGNLIDKLVNKI